MKDNKISTYSEEELRRAVTTEREALQKLRFAHSISSVENPLKIRSARRAIARLKTALRSKELGR